MKPTVVFVRVVTKQEYRHGEGRLLDSYRKFDAGVEHDLVIIDRCGDSPDDVPGAKHIRYDGGGWDCGAWQFAGRNIDAELLVCFNSSCYITGHNWLLRFVAAVEAHGDGLYGPLTSNEVFPHVRTPCMIFQPKIINDYPAQVESRLDTYRFESMGFSGGPPNFTQWTKQHSHATMLVTWYGAYDMEHWRDPANIFRKGNQQSLIVKDRHCDAYEASDEAGKAMLEGLAGRGDLKRQEEIEAGLPRWKK
jgi:hypothetical protein